MRRVISTILYFHRPLKLILQPAGGYHNTNYILVARGLSRNFNLSQMQTPCTGDGDGSGSAAMKADSPERTDGEAAEKDSKVSEEMVHETDGSNKGSTDQTKPKMSRRAMKRMIRNRQREAARNGRAAKKRKKEVEHELNFSEHSLKDTEYYFENGLRKVYPYYFTFKTYAKGRWVGKRMMDIFADEFKAYKVETYAEAVKSGRVTVNHQKVGLDYVFKENDYVENVIHRHELPIVGSKINIIEDSENFVIIDKPSSIPIHPCGRYRHNSLTYIMAIEHGYRNLRTIYRLDRLTSGVFIFCKNDSQTRLMQDHIKGRLVEKTYMARVSGEFPLEPIVCEGPIDNLTQKIGLFKVGPNGKEAKTSFERVSYNGETSVVLCKPHTGRTHQIRVHLQYIGYPIVNDPLYNSEVWGPERGKCGNFGKPEEQLIQDLISHHTAERFGGDALIENTDRTDNGDKGVVPAQTSLDSDKCDIVDTHNKQESVLSLSKPVVGEGERLVNDSKQGQEKISDSKSGDGSNPGFNAQKVTTDPVCEECKRAYKEPKESDLVMYLHALSYKGPGWSFQTDMPEWAKEDWKTNL